MKKLLFLLLFLPCLGFSQANILGWTVADTSLVFGIQADGSGAVITTGVNKGDFVMPYQCHITGWQALSDISGSVTINVDTCNYARFGGSHPVAADSMFSTPITFAGDFMNQATGLWIAVPKNKICRWRFEHTATLTKLLVVVFITRY